MGMKNIIIAAALAWSFSTAAGAQDEAAAPPPAEGPTAHQILERIDHNEVADTEVIEFSMVINRGGRRKPKVLEMKAWIKGLDAASMEVVSGPDKGTRYLKLGDDLWIASREAEKPMKISGHMLRQSMLDSDWSYEDSTSNEPLASRFDAKITGEEVVDGRKCWVLEVTARNQGESYPHQTLWVDQETYLPVKQELKALSGMLLKTLTYQDLKKTDDRWTPMKMTMKDELKNDTSTVVEVKSIQFGVPIDDSFVSLEFVENVH